MFDKLTFFHSF